MYNETSAMNMKFQNRLFLKKITFWYFRGMKTTTVPEMVFHPFIGNDVTSVEKYACLIGKQYLIDIR